MWPFWFCSKFFYANNFICSAKLHSAVNSDHSTHNQINNQTHLKSAMQKISSRTCGDVPHLVSNWKGPASWRQRCNMEGKDLQVYRGRCKIICRKIKRETAFRCVSEAVKYNSLWRLSSCRLGARRYSARRLTRYFALLLFFCFPNPAKLGREHQAFFIFGYSYFVFMILTFQELQLLFKNQCLLHWCDQVNVHAVALPKSNSMFWSGFHWRIYK